MKRTVYGSMALVFVLAGCKAEKGASLQIIDSPTYEDDCTLSATPTTFQSTGFFDPIAAGGAYTLTLYMTNLMNDQDNPAAITGDPNIKPNANDALIIGFDTCYYRGDDADATAYDSGGKGLIKDCDDVPSAQRKFSAASGTVTSGGGFLALSVATLFASDLQGIFGDGFDLTALRSAYSTGGLAAIDPTNSATRNAGFGDFPASRSVEVIVQVRARAKTQNGSTIRSNWFALPVFVSPGAVVEPCDTPSVRSCGDGTTALQGSNLPDAACAALIPQGATYTCEAVNDCA